MIGKIFSWVSRGLITRVKDSCFRFFICCCIEVVFIWSFSSVSKSSDNDGDGGVVVMVNSC